MEKGLIKKDKDRLLDLLKLKDDELNKQIKEAGNNHDKLRELELWLKLQQDEADRLRKEQEEKQKKF